MGETVYSVQNSTIEALGYIRSVREPQIRRTGGPRLLGNAAESSVIRVVNSENFWVRSSNPIDDLSSQHGFQIRR